MQGLVRSRKCFFQVKEIRICFYATDSDPEKEKQEELQEECPWEGKKGWAQRNNWWEWPSTEEDS